MNRPAPAVRTSPSASEPLTLAGVHLVADPDGALYWPAEGVLAVSDLHLEKGSSFAVRGQMLPPYDTAATLMKLAKLITRYNPRCVIALGDSFHDRRGADRLSEENRAGVLALQSGRDWIWITGNHDPDPATGIGGTFGGTLQIGALSFRHEPTGAPGEIAGHLHPCARVSHRGQTVGRRCFAADSERLVMPAFGAFTGGLNVRHEAFVGVFGSQRFTAHMLGEGRLYAFAVSNCLGD
jgi:DNA ligase-associated metallophosphoesterase